MRRCLTLLLLCSALAACGTSTGGGGGYFPLADGTANTDDSQVSDSTAAPTDAPTSVDAVTADAKAPADVPPTALATCTLVGQCTHDDCEKNWSTGCGAACAKAAAPAAAGPASVLQVCSTSKCAQGPCKSAGKPDEKCMDDCVGKQCPTELGACWEQGAGIGAGGCSAALTCFTACENLTTGKFTCQANCFTAMTTAARSDFKAVATCLGTGGDAKACMQPSLVCLADGKQGQKSCYDLFPCVQACGKDVNCMGNCYGTGNPAAQQQLVQLIQCVTGPTPNECMQQTVKCAAPSGSKGCMAIATCAQNCPAGAGQAACAFECLHSGTADGADAFAPLATCMQQKCANCTASTCQSCATSKCLSQAMACSSN